MIKYVNKFRPPTTHTHTLITYDEEQQVAGIKSVMKLCVLVGVAWLRKVRWKLCSPSPPVIEERCWSWLWALPLLTGADNS